MTYLTILLLFKHCRGVAYIGACLTKRFLYDFSFHSKRISCNSVTIFVLQIAFNMNWKSYEAYIKKVQKGFF